MINKQKIIKLSFLGLLTSCTFSVPHEVSTAYEDIPENIDFNFHVKPILSDRCYNCHGPDANTRKAGLRLDLEKEAFAKLSSGHVAFAAKKPNKSEAILRILSDDPEQMMPPPDSHLALSSKEKAIIIKWVEQGAKWKAHWAFVKAEEISPPDIKNKSWRSHNEIDAFIFQKLAQHGYTPSEQADKERLLRRVSIDLTGLPPTIEALDDFLADHSPNAYEKAVDRLLKSDAYAERLTLDWMDLSRYADSHGMHADGWRLMWPWRDWVINAFKNNMPYDQFVTWQLAGDLMPNATREQKLATGFNRNHTMTAEGGVIDEEFRLNYVFDRTETVSASLLGLTMNCAKCHDHKFDPISQKDYYQLTAFFNNVKEIGMTGDDGNYGPMLPLTDKKTAQDLEILEKSIQLKENELALIKEEIHHLIDYNQQLPHTITSEGLIGYFPFDNVVKKRVKNQNRIWIDHNKNAYASQTHMVTGKKGNALHFTGEYDEVQLREIPNFEWTDAFSAAIWANTTKRTPKKTQTLLGTSGNKNNFWRGWDFYLDDHNRLNMRLIHSLPHNYIHLQTTDSIQTNQWNHLAFSYDGSGKAKGIQLFINGKKATTAVAYDKLYKSIKTVTTGSHRITKIPVKVAKSNRAFTGELGIFKGALDEVYIYDRPISELEVSKLAEVSIVSEANLDELQKAYWIKQHPRIKAHEKTLKKLRSNWLQLMQPVIEVMVMEDMPDKRPTHVLNRGEYDQPLYEVEANTPEILPNFPENYPKNRLGLAKWMFDTNNPLTARVTVNRYWQMLFGSGLVKTPQDFGVQGALPTHPELLDWLANSFVARKWDVKWLIKTMVMSSTYRQSSVTHPKLQEEDPDNIFLARSNSYRLPAEVIRDNALATSGLLVNHLGGESVKPYQPENLWIEKSNFSHKLLRYKVSEGDSLYRRSLYTFIRRTSPPPAMVAFDAPNREVCTIKRENTNTPLQALVLLNDTQFVEASRVLAERVQKEGGSSISDQLSYAFRLATSRKPKPAEIQVIRELYEAQLKHFQSKPKEAVKLLNIGKKPFDANLNHYKTAAIAMVANTILNHDDTYMKR